ncbi:MAG TPA: ferredoxin [Candidatus Pacearchaeota archaeon]|mgnify:CR=1 FL=1|nr:ferredoxin [Candidatus Pacearchaeota archaeon]HOK94008.1 ferredoxin [Candidatus Pacearchaeota archaeon]HPO75079.1 ferredoxin [Candidatus Pacearchaeota archaeon]
MTKKIIIDEENCIGCGTCQALCPEVFELDQGKLKAKIKENANIEENQECINEAIASCPMNAIKET